MRKSSLAAKIVFILPVVVGAACLIAMTRDKVELTYTDLFNPLGLVTPLDVPQVGQFLEPGKVVCPGYAATGDPVQPCPEGSRIVIRRSSLVTRVESESGELAGSMTLEGNGNWAPDYTGPFFGTLSIQLDKGGAWVGTWNGIRRVVGTSAWTAEIRAVGHGVGGEVDGMQLKCVEVISWVTPMPILYKGVATCRVLDPGDE